MVKIYSLEDPSTNEIRYIGKTVTSLEERLGGHLRDTPKRNTKSTAWIKSLFKRNLLPKIELLEEVLEEDWEEAERFYISYFRFLGFNLTNILEGGNVSPAIKARKLSKSQIEKMLFTRAKGNYTDKTHHYL